MIYSLLFHYQVETHELLEVTNLLQLRQNTLFLLLQ